MEHVIVAVRDSKSELFSAPMFFRSKGEAVRAFGDEVNNPGGVFYKHPEDYCMYHLGTYDDTAGLLQPLALGPVSLALAASLFVAGSDGRQLSLLNGGR